MPAQAVLDGIAELQERFFHFLAHLRGWRGTERGHLAVPTRGKFATVIFQARQCVQGAEMFEHARASATHFCGVNELAPGFVRKENERTKFAALLDVAKNFRGDA